MSATPERSEEGRRAAAPLVNTGERSHSRCAAPARGIAWQLPDGSLVPVRCGASNRCWYCARLASIENMVVLQLDARENSAPTAVMTLTTVEVATRNAELRKSIEQVTRALRRLWPALEYCGFVEWTTGKGRHSGGRRRVHVHFLLKGLPSEELPLAELKVRDVWFARTGAHRVEVRELRVAGGATAYMALHHEKTTQGPPPGWKGKRLRPSRRYFGPPGTIPQLRDQARALLLDKRLRKLAEQTVWELIDDARGSGTIPPDWYYDAMLEREVERVLDEHKANAPQLVNVTTRTRLDRSTGEVTYDFGAVLGPHEPRRREQPLLPNGSEGPTIPTDHDKSPGAAATARGTAQEI